MAPPTPSRPPDSIQPIKPLPESTTHLLRSTLVIPSLPSCLVELVQNALDAQASKIEVSIDLDTWTIRCDDNGCGMDLDTLRALGEGERYWTSKAMPGDALHETFGFRGEALASMAQNGLLEIVTEKHEGSQALSLVIRGGKRLYVGKAIMGRATGRGSTVWVRDLFYKVSPAANKLGGTGLTPSPSVPVASPPEITLDSFSSCESSLKCSPVACHDLAAASRRQLLLHRRGHEHFSAEEAADGVEVK